jgi:lactose/L-arabinose transport system ATP-binding protein
VQLKLTTDIVEHLGGESYIYARTQANQRIVMKLADARQFRTGEAITAAFDVSRAFLFDAAGMRLR